MTTRTRSTAKSVTIIWPERESDAEYEYEHAVVIERWSGSITIRQKDAEVTVPKYAIDELIRALRVEARAD